MKEDIIQNQITLIAFKAVKVEFLCSLSPKDKTPQNTFDIRLNNLRFEDAPNLFAKVFFIDLVQPTSHKDETMSIKIEFHTVFQCSDKIDESFMESDFVKISAPAIGFPYLRAFVSTITLQSGLPTVILPSINFVQFSKEQVVDGN